MSKMFHFRNIFLFFILSLVSFFYPNFSYAAFTNTPNEDAWYSYGTVYDMERIGNYLYVGGDFEYFGPDTGLIGIFDEDTEELVSPKYVPFTGFYILDAVSDNAGGWYVVGYFSEIQGVARSTAAHILPDGTIDPDWATPDLGVRSDVVEYDPITNRVFIGYGSIKGYDGTTGAYDSTYNFSVDGTLYDLEIDNGYLYVAGSFSNLAGSARNKLGAINISTKTLDATWNPNIGGTTPYVNDIDIYGSVIYAVGKFTSVNGGTTRNRAAAFNLAGGGRTGTASSWNPNIGTVEANSVESNATTVYIGGQFTTVNGSVSRTDLASFDTVNGTVTSWDPAPQSFVGRIYALQLNTDESRLFVGGGFNQINNEIRTAMAVIDTSSGNLATGWETFSAMQNNSVGVIEYDGDQIFTGGAYSHGGVPYSGIVRLNLDGSVDPTWNPNMEYDAIVNDIESDGTNLYLGGSFASVDGQTRNNLVAVKISDASVVSAFNPNINNAVNKMKYISSSGTLYVGGDFTTVNGGTTRNYLAAFTVADGVVTSFNPNMESVVYGLDSDGSVLYVGGSFISVAGGTSRGYAAAYNLSDHSLLSWNPQLSDWTRDIAVDLDDDLLYLVGDFTTVAGGTPRGQGAQYDISTPTSPSLTSWNPQIDDYTYMVELNDDDDTVFVGGWFVNAGGQARNYVAEISASTGLATSFNPDPDSDVYAIEYVNDTYWIGGDFSEVNTSSTPYGTDSGLMYFAQFGDTPVISTPTVAFTSTTGSGSESTTSVNIGLSLSASTGSNVTVDYVVTGTATGGGTDYTLANGTATITSGNTTTNIPLTVVNDSTDESDETVIITISNPSNATLGANTVFTYTITDNDDPVSDPTPDENGNPNKPTSFGPADTMKGKVTKDKTPKIDFKITDPDNDNTSYKIQIAKDKNFENIVIEYRSIAVSDENQNFTVGQDEDGQYDKGSKNQELPDGKYFVRVKAFDTNDNQSAYAEVNNGDVAFIIDTTPPVLASTLGVVNNIAEIIATTDEVVSYTIKIPGLSDISDDEFAKEHLITLNDLAPGVEYKSTLIVVDEAGNETSKDIIIVNVEDQNSEQSEQQQTQVQQNVEQDNQTTTESAVETLNLPPVVNDITTNFETPNENETSNLSESSDILKSVNESLQALIPLINEDLVNKLARAIVGSILLVSLINLLATAKRSFSSISKYIPILSTFEAAGLVFDAVNKKPIYNAAVTLLTLDGKIVKKVLTTKNGEFLFIAKNRPYKIIVNKYGYSFPSIRDFRGDEVYGNKVYLGGKIESKDAVVAVKIPLDPQGNILKGEKTPSRLEVLYERFKKSTWVRLEVLGLLINLALILYNYYYFDVLLFGIWMIIPILRLYLLSRKMDIGHAHIAKL